MFKLKRDYYLLCLGYVFFVAPTLARSNALATSDRHKLRYRISTRKRPIGKVRKVFPTDVKEQKPQKQKASMVFIAVGMIGVVVIINFALPSEPTHGLLLRDDGITYAPHFGGKKSIPDYLLKIKQDEDEKLKQAGNSRCCICCDGPTNTKGKTFDIKNASEMVNACKKAFEKETSHRLCLSCLYQIIVKDHASGKQPTCPICRTKYEKGLCKEIVALCTTSKGKARLIKRKLEKHYQK